MATLVFLLNAMYGGNLPPSDVQANITVKGVSYVINLLYIVEIVLSGLLEVFVLSLKIINTIPATL